MQKGYKCLLPTYRQKRKRTDRIVEIDLPLFPSYVFCQFTECTLGKAVMTPGVIRIVGFGGKPAVVDVAEVEALQTLAGSDLLREPWSYLPTGTRVSVQSGPLTGVEGVILSQDNKHRLILSVSLLQRSVAIQLDENTVFSILESGEHKQPGNAKMMQSAYALKLLA